MLHPYTILLLSLAVLYAATLLLLGRGLRKLPPGRNRAKLLVSVVIAARNEEHNIQTCLQHVLQQDYPSEKLEVIVVDDRSEDNTAAMVAEFARQDPRVTLLRIRDVSGDLAPKKRAIDTGVRHATGEIILTTDADCTPGPGWVAEMVRHFEPPVGMVAGYNPYETARASVFHRMLALDYFAMAAVAAASAGLGYPISCTGGNLAYRREVYFESGGLQHLGAWISGDDDLFLEQVRDKTDWRIRYAVNAASFVPTQPPGNIAEFVQQRIRYASKGRHYKWNVTVALILIYVMNFCLVFGPLAALFQPVLLAPWLAALFLKWLVEFSFLQQAKVIFRATFSKSDFVLTALIHPLYIVLAGLAGQVAGFQWKGESYRAKLRPQLQAQPDDL